VCMKCGSLNIQQPSGPLNTQLYCPLSIQHGWLYIMCASFLANCDAWCLLFVNKQMVHCVCWLQVCGQGCDDQHAPHTQQHSQPRLQEWQLRYQLHTHLLRWTK
jgi:uncharacterized membrane protein